jgi:hypothetical protein
LNAEPQDRDIFEEKAIKISPYDGGGRKSYDHQSFVFWDERVDFNTPEKMKIPKPGLQRRYEP